MGLGWIMTIVIGGLAGWLAEKIMKANMGLIANILIGIAGAVVMNFILSRLGIFVSAGLIAQAVSATAGACLLIFIYRAIRSR